MDHDHPTDTSAAQDKFDEITARLRQLGPKAPPASAAERLGVDLARAGVTVLSALVTARVAARWLRHLTGALAELGLPVPVPDVALSRRITWPALSLLQLAAHLTRARPRPRPSTSTAGRR